MLANPVLLSTAAEMIHNADGAVPAPYIAGQARRFVREGLVKPAAYIGSGANKRALIDTYEVCRLAVLSFMVRKGLDLGDLKRAAMLLDQPQGEPGRGGPGFPHIVDELISALDNPDAEITWHFHLHETPHGILGSAGSAWEPSIVGSYALCSTQVNLRAVLLPVLAQIRAHENA